MSRPNEDDVSFLPTKKSIILTRAFQDLSRSHDQGVDLPYRLDMSRIPPVLLVTSDSRLSPPPENDYSPRDDDDFMPEPESRARSRPRRRSGKRKSIKPTPEQTECCVIGCKNGVTNRLRFSLRCLTKSDFKPAFIQTGLDKVCHYHYFSDLYKYKKMVKAQKESEAAVERAARIEARKAAEKALEANRPRESSPAPDPGIDAKMKTEETPDAGA